MLLFGVRNRRLIFSRLIRFFLISSVLWIGLEYFLVRRGLYQAAIKEASPFGREKVFIASTHWTDENILRQYWMSAVVQLASDIGPENVFVSVYESGSLDDSKGALRELNGLLSKNDIPHKVVLDETSHKDEVEKPPESTGWVQMPETKAYRDNWTDWFTLQKNTWVPRRIPFLARSRNMAMEPLYELQQTGQTFDKVLWLNDVVFTSRDVRNLLSTRNGDFAAACALDFKLPPAFYDMFALRDAEGHAPLSDNWPFFWSARSRNALEKGQPVPVASCWNGMVAFDAAPFYAADRPLRFRALPDSLAVQHLEASECCLVHADNPLSQTKGVWVNPNVRVAYSGPAYEAVNRKVWPSAFAIVRGLWQNRASRSLFRFGERAQAVQSKIEAWKAIAPSHAEPGEYCIIDEMQILLWNGWGHA